MQVESPPQRESPHIERVEPRGERLRRHGHQTGLYTMAFSLVALLVVLIALAVANTRQVKLSWVAGSGHASLVWIILASAVLGWLLGIVTSVVFRLRTRRRGKLAAPPSLLQRTHASGAEPGLVSPTPLGPVRRKSAS